MQLSAQEFVSFYRPSPCPSRVYLRAHNVPEAEPTAWDVVLRELGQRHETSHLNTFPAYLDLGAGDFDTRVAATTDAVLARRPVIYQGILRAPVPDSTVDVVIGIPDFMIAREGSYAIRDCKLARHADEDRHPEILRQLELYSWLFQNTFGIPPAALEVLMGDTSIVSVPVEDGRHALNKLQEIKYLKTQDAPSYTPVGWSKCQGCGFNSHCWGNARSSQDISLLPDLDQSAAVALHEQGILSVSDLLHNYDHTSLAEIKRPVGNRVQRIGTKATAVLLQARALHENAVVQVGPIILNLGENVVMFDLEGMPPHLDELEKIYLWGMQVFGARPSNYKAATADFGHDGDRNGWLSFLDLIKDIFAQYGDIQFVHWHHYEKTNLKRYLNRYGDVDGVGQRVLDACVDLHPIVKKALVFPLPSYSLKVIEEYVGFQRTMEEYGGSWSMAQYVKAVETEDATLRDQVMADIQKYNREDLEATWAVIEWLKGRA